MKAVFTTLPRILLINMVTIVSAAVGLFVMFLLYYEGGRFDDERRNLEKDQLEPRKQELKQQVDSATTYIEFRRSQIEQQAKDDIRERVLEAHAVATHIVEKYRYNKTDQELQELVREALRPIRFAQGKGYFFATSLDGVEQLFADRPSFEGKNLLGIRDTEGRYVIADMISLVRRQGEGFYRYTWSKPEQHGKNFPKIAFVKHFKPFNWFIGSGLYLDDYKQQVQSEIADYLETVRFGKDGYLFATQWDGVVVTGPGKGKNMLAVTDADGNRIVEKLIALSKEGGGYIRYRMPDISGVRQGTKLSYVRGVTDWQWYVGAGVYVQDIEDAVQQARHAMMMRLLKTFLFLFATLAGFVLFAFWVAYRAAAKIKLALANFTQFFEQASVGPAYLAPESLPFEELQTIALSANKMVSERKRIEEKLHEQTVRLEQEIAEHQVAQESLAVSKHELEAVNLTLEERIAEEVAKNTEKHRIMLHQGRLAAMGEMIASIAHQWRQPLNNLAIMLQTVKIDGKLQQLDQKALEQHVALGMEMIMYMSKTIDDFRNFFLPEREPREFQLMDSIRSAVSLVRADFKNRGIVIEVIDDMPGVITGFPRECAQAVLNILNNAKDACLLKKVADPQVTVHASCSGGRAVVIIRDNAGGIAPEVIEKIFIPILPPKTKRKVLG